MTIPCKYFYDRRGCELFEQICETDDYYVTRTELEIMHRCAGEISRAIGTRAAIIELGSGSCRKTQLLLDSLDAPAAYIPIDISHESLVRSEGWLARRYHGLEILPICGDFTRRIRIPRMQAGCLRRIVYFPGSTIGNFGPRRVDRLMRRLARLCGPGGGLLIGIDLKKDSKVLERAYDDRAGITRQFNLNVLARINRELGAGFRIDQFRHRARYNPRAGRIEMHLVSRCLQSAAVDDLRFTFEAGDWIRTECSYKYRIGEFRDRVEPCGWRLQRAWVDDRQFFSVLYFVAA